MLNFLVFRQPVQVDMGMRTLPYLPRNPESSVASYQGNVQVEFEDGTLRRRSGSSSFSISECRFQEVALYESNGTYRRGTEDKPQ